MRSQTIHTSILTLGLCLGGTGLGCGEILDDGAHGRAGFFASAGDDNGGDRADGESDDRGADDNGGDRADGESDDRGADDNGGDRADGESDDRGTDDNDRQPGAFAAIPLALAVTPPDGAAPDAAPGEHGPIRFHDSAGVQFTVESGFMVVESIIFDLPLGTLCADIEHAVVGATCFDPGEEELEDEFEAPHAEDDVPDLPVQKRRSGTDDGTDDDGTEDEPAHDELPEGAEVEGAELVVTGPILFDMTTGQTWPNISDVRIPELGYERIEVRVDGRGAVLPAGAPTTGGASLRVAAAFELMGEPLTLDVYMEDQGRIRAEAVGGILPDATSGLFVAMDVAAWFAGLPITPCIEETSTGASGGVIRLEESDELDDCVELIDEVEDRMRE